MRRVALLLPLAFLPQPAHAAGGTVTVSYAVHVVHLDGRDVMVAECDATANPGTSGDVALLTRISCSIDGVSVTLTEPGSKAGAVLASAPAEAHRLCFSGAATFLSSTGNYSVSTTPECVEV